MNPIEKEMASMPPEVSRKLVRAQGLAQARMPRLAQLEMEQVPPEHRQSRAWHFTKLEIAQAAQDWPSAYDSAAVLVESFPSQPEFRVTWAYAARRYRGLGEAETILEEALKDFPSQPIFHYNLACYAAVDGRVDLALGRVMKAIDMEKGYLSMALEDKDLESLWDILMTLEPDT
jgi:predicted Zn-dependent protease